MAYRFLIALLLLCATSVDAQLASMRQRNGPIGFVSLGAGFLRPAHIRDGSTSADWLFDATIQYQGSVEYALRNQSAVGIAGSYARVPLEYRDRDGLFPACAACDADATIWTALAFFRAGGGSGFHQLIELGVGATGYQDFETEDGSPLPPAKADMDITLSVGYGFGYGFGDRAAIFLVQSADQSLHQRGDGSNEGTTSVQHFVTRIGLRYGLGNRRTY